MSKYDKLIRDKIPYRIWNKFFSVRVASDNELEEYVIKKVHEEIEEFLENPSLEEAADVVEIIDKLFQTTLNVKIFGSEIRQARSKKNKERGAFEENLILLEVQDDE